jgi:hypothetical protein
MYPDPKKVEKHWLIVKMVSKNEGVFDKNQFSTWNLSFLVHFNEKDLQSNLKIDTN